MMMPKTRLAAGERQLEIVRAVLTLAAENSPDAITTQAIAQQMGLTQGAVFRHFPTREAIWLAVVDWVEQNLGDVIAAAVAEVRDPVEGLGRLFEAHVAFIAAHPSAPRLIFNELQKPAENPVKQRVRGLLDRYRQRTMEHQHIAAMGILHKLIALTAMAAQQPNGHPPGFATPK